MKQVYFTVNLQFQATTNFFIYLFIIVFDELVPLFDFIS